MKKTFTTKLLAILTCVCMVFGFTACADQEDIDNAVNPVSEQITAINATITEMKTLDTTLDGYIDSLETKVAALETDLSAVNTDLETLEENSATKTALTDAKTALETAIKEIKADIQTLKEKDTQLDGKITELETSLSTEIADMETWVKETYATITACETLKTEINESITSLYERLTTLEITVSALSTTVTDIQTQLNENTDKLTELEIIINCLEGKHAWDNGICKHCDIAHVHADTDWENCICTVCGVTATFDLSIDTSVWNVWKENSDYQDGLRTGYTTFMPNHDNGAGTREAEITMYVPAGEATITWEWAVSQGFIQYGKFEYKFFVNGEEIESAYRDFTITPNPYAGISSETYTFTSTGEEVTFRWVFEKTMPNGAWGDDSGRQAYIGNINLTCTAIED